MIILLQITIVLLVAAAVITAIVVMKKDSLSRPGGTSGNAMQTVHEIFDPGIKNTIEVMQEKRTMEDNSGATK